MALKVSTDVQNTVQMLWDVGAIGGLTDAQLLERFLAGADEVSEASFAALVERHGPAVRRVCVDVLSDPHEAQDAAQAAFLVLARKARSIRKPELLGPWLHGVALRIARRARKAAARRREVEQRRAEVMAKRSNSTEATDPDLYIELYEEIERLPEKYRNPIVLCYLQGHTHMQAAQRLGWALGTVQIRLHRGRERLRTRLARRGVGVCGLAAAVLTLPQKTATAASVPVKSGWVKATAIAAVRFAARKTTAGLVAPSALTLAESVLAMMLMDTLKALAFGMLAVGLASAGVALGVHALASGREPHSVRPESVAGVVPQAVARAEPLRVMPPARKRPDVEQATKAGVRHLKKNQRVDGSWPDLIAEAHTGMTSLVTLALLGAGEPADSPTITRAIEYLRGFSPDQLNYVYSVSLQTRVFAAAAHEQDKPRIARNVVWLKRAQIRAGDPVKGPGGWSYNQDKNRNGDNSNTFYALLGLHAAEEAGVPVKPEVWALADRHWRSSQRADGGWGYTPGSELSTASMTCEGIAGLILTRTRRVEEQEAPAGAEFRDCGKWKNDPGLSKGMEWMTKNFHIGENSHSGQQWRFYYLDGLERVGQLSGERLLGTHDWFREGAEELIRTQSKDTGEWPVGVLVERNPTLATSFALMFLCRGRSPVLIQKARHAPLDDWMNDPDDVRNLVGSVARDWKIPLNWQVVDLDSATADDLLLAPILFLNGHQAPELADRAKKALIVYVERGGFIFAEACCGKSDFDHGFRALLKEIFPAPESQLRPLAPTHRLWTARHALKPEDHALWGLEQKGRTAVVYSPDDLSCRWNLRDRYPDERATRLAIQVGQNVVTYASARKAAR